MTKNGKLPTYFKEYLDVKFEEVAESIGDVEQRVEKIQVCLEGTDTQAGLRIRVKDLESKCEHIAKRVTHIPKMFILVVVLVIFLMFEESRNFVGGIIKFLTSGLL